MIKLKRYLKPFITIIIGIVIFLFVQAMLDLNLPKLMSSIVDVGIQNSGIESTSPEAISADAKDFMVLFMTDEEALLVEKTYTETDGKKDYLTVTLPEKTNAFVINENIDEETQIKLDTAFQNASIALIYFLQDNAQSKEQSSMEEIDISTVDLTPMFEMAPIIALQKEIGALEDYIKRAKDTPEMLKEQSSYKFVQIFYSQLGIDTDKMQQNYIYKTGAKMALVALISIIASISVSYLTSKLAANVSHDIRQDLFEKIESFSLQEYSKFSSSSFITRIINDVQEIFGLLNMGLRMLFYAPIMVVGGVIMILQTNISMLWIILVPAVLMIAIFVAIYILGLPKFKLQQEIADKINRVSRESLSGMMVVRAFGNEGFEEKRFDEVNQEAMKTNKFIGKLMSIVFPAVMIIMNLTTVLTIWVGSDKIAASTLQVGDMMAFIQYSMQIIFSFITIAMMFVFIPRASVSGNRIQEVFEIDLVITSPEKPKSILEDKKGWVEFENVSFKYPGAENPVLSNISFTAKPGEMVAFIGSTGSGKSTIINLVPRLYDVTEGVVKVNGIDVKDQDLLSLRDSVGYIAQENILLSGSIEYNLKYGNVDASKKDMEKAVEVSQAKEFIDSLDDPYNHKITQGATNVSGGQRQRLSIARALTKNAPVYVFDDSFSALDFKTDAKLRKALMENAKESALLIVGQRVASIMAADQIIVLENGEIVGHGVHKELLKTCKTYLEIAKSQLREEEL